LEEWAMPMARVNGVELYYEETGEGYPLILSHEFAGDYRSWEPQVRFFSRRYRVITWNYRGYPPSEVPEDAGAYSEEQLVEDLYGLLGHLGIEQAHIAGLSMGGAITLKLGMAHPEVCRSLTIAAAGAGAVDHERFVREAAAQAERFERDPARSFASYAVGPARVQLRQKDPRGWREFAEQLAEHSPKGSAYVFRGVQIRRKTIFEVADELPGVQVPALIMVGDEDEPCLEPALVMKRRLPNAGLAVFPKSGHAINLEEPAAYNRVMLDFLTAVEQGRWLPRGEVTTSMLPAEAREGSGG
jgi:pimeloyl-ACP methyl ester carboxylesterase